MNRKWLAVAFLVAIVSLVMVLPGCGSKQQLVGLAITPSSETFLSPDPQSNVQLKVYGTYVHPPATKDLTTQVTWTSNTPQVAVVNGDGLLSPSGIGCGGAIISASLLNNKPTGNVAVATMTVTVDDAAVKVCPQPSLSNSQ
jgi:hypothetical protein